MKILLLPFSMIFLLWMGYSCRSGDHSREALEGKALHQGRLITDSTQKLLSANLGKAIQQKGLRHAIDYCNTEAMPLMHKMEEEWEVGIKRTALKLRNPENKPDSLETTLLNTYDSLVSNGQELSAGTRWKNENTLLYTRPIRISSGLCLNCHGTPGGTLADTVYGFIKQKYPKDEATGYEQGDFRGMWSITFPRKQLEAMPANQ